jgi:hypothetical protein
MASYAKEIEHRAVFNNWNSYSRAVGQFRIRGLAEDDNERNRIGTEVCFKRQAGNGGRYYNAESNGANWILRVYADGTAYYYPDKLQHIARRTRSEIHEMIMKHFRVVKEEELEHVDYYARKFQVLRRKPLGTLSKRYFIKSVDFGQFLALKYNDLETRT